MCRGISDNKGLIEKDAPRVMRLPGFINTKPPVAPTRIIQTNPNLRYDITEVERHLPDVPTKRQKNRQQDDDILSPDLPDADAEAVVKKCMELLSPKRCRDYGDWLKVGMILHHLGRPVDEWDQWSRADDKYSPCICQEKWATFSVADGREKVGIGTLLSWASEDSGVPVREILDGVGALSGVCR